MSFHISIDLGKRRDHTAIRLAPRNAAFRDSRGMAHLRQGEFKQSIADYDAALAERHPHDLSAGERERLSLAAVLAIEPDFLVLDEPTRGVDPERKVELAQLLRSEAAQRGTLVVTHDLPWAAEVADRVVELDVREGVRA